MTEYLTHLGILVSVFIGIVWSLNTASGYVERYKKRREKR